MRLSKLIRVASKSRQRFRHATIIMKGGALIAAACNTAERHAEDRAIRRLWPSYARGSTVINVRITKRGFGCSRPCLKCMELLRKEKVRKVIYTNEHGLFVVETLR